MATNKEQALIEVVLKGQQANASLKDMEKAVRSLSAQLRGLPKDSQQFADKKAEFQKMSKSLKDLQNDVKGVGGVFQSIGKEIKGFGILAAGYLGFDWLTSSISGIIKNNAALSDSLADIRKTTGMTEAEAKKLNTAFGQIDTRTAAKELRNIAIVGGQLGIAKGDIFGFTVAVDKMNVALGDEFTGGAEEVTKAMGGLRNIFTDIKTDKVDQDLLHIGNAINVLASSGAATGPVVSDFANRIGGVGMTLGLTSGQVLGLSATLQELNVSTERGGTAVTKILQKMTTNTADFAKVAGIPVKEFTELVNKDLYGAFVKVVEGSKKGNVSATDFGKTLDSLGVDGAGASEVFAKLGTNTKMLSEKVLMANSALKNTDSILAEFNTKNTTLAAEMERLSKGFASAFTNSTVSGGIKSIVSGIADLFDNTKKLSDVTKEERQELMLTETEIFSYNAGNETRTKLIKELQEKYPDFLKNINAETVSNTELHNALDKVNASLINKIVIQKKDEEIQELAETAAEKKLASTEAKRKIIEALTAAYNSNARALKFQKEMEGLPIEVQAEQITQNFNEAGLSAYNENILAIQKGLKEWRKLEAEASGASIPLNEVLNEKSELMKILGIETDKTTAATENNTKGTKIQTEGQVVAADEFAKFLQKIKDLEREQELGRLSGYAKEIEVSKDKYDKLRAEATGHSDVIKRIDALEEEENFQLAIKYANKESEQAAKDLDSQLKRFKKLKEEKDKIENAPGIETNLTPAQKAKKETDDLNRQWDERIEAATNYNLSLKAGEEEFAIDIIALTEAKNAQLEALNLKHQETIDEQNNQAFIKQISNFEKGYQTSLKVMDTLIQAKKQMYDREINDNNAKATHETKIQKKLLDAKVINEKEYEKRVEKIENDKEAKNLRVKQKQAKQDKQYAMFKIALNTAIGVSKAIAEGNYLEAIAVGALGAIEFGIAAATPIPQFAKGGYSNKPQGYTSGATLYDSPTSGQYIAGEKGTEWIASNWMVNDPVYGPQIDMLEKIQRSGYSSSSTPTPSFSGQNSTSSSGSKNELLGLAAVVGELSNTVKSLQQNGIQAYQNYDVLVKEQKNIDTARKSAQVTVNRG